MIRSTLTALALATGGLLVATQVTLASDAGACIPMGGLGTYNYDADGRSGVAAMLGAFAGGVRFAQTSEFETVDEEGRMEATFAHMFVTEDGSTLRTEDRSWGYAVPGTDYVVGGAAYTVVEATGRFEGHEGTFHSWGTFAPTKGQAILRYEGEVCPVDAS